MSAEQKFVSKTWGYENWIVNENYCGKVLFVKQGRKCSAHFHKQKEETFYIQDGEITPRYYEPHLVRTAGNKWLSEERIRELFFEVKDGEVVPTMCKTIVLRAGQSFHIPIGMLHQFHGNLDTTIIEFSTHHEDSDSYRILPPLDIQIEIPPISDVANNIKKDIDAKWTQFNEAMKSSGGVMPVVPTEFCKSLEQDEPF